MIQFEFLLIIFIVNLFIVLNFNDLPIFKFAIDKPDKQRKFHKKPTALAGGIILMLNLLIYYFFLIINQDLILSEFFFKNFKELNSFIITCLLIFSLGLFDDKLDIKPNTKFLLLIVIVGQFILLNKDILIQEINFSFISGVINLGKYSFFFTLFSLIVFINAFNMFDGINLQASSFSLIVFIYFLFLNQSFTLIFILIIFIIFYKILNFLNKSFLGDNGSLLISFIIGVIFIKFFNMDMITFSDEILIYMIIPGVDMIRLFFERIKKRRHPFSFDRSHIHHLLLERLNHFQTIIVINLLIITPILLNHLEIQRLKIIICTLFAYFLIIYLAKKLPKINY
tara:strand:- start:410 stop:1429 length:1020 start_codon:yes stop_codon:yes gene_type:complete